MTMTRKQYADRKKVTEKTVRTWIEAAGIDREKAAFSDQEVRLLDYVKTLLDQGKTLAEVTATISAESGATDEGRAVAGATNPLFDIIQDDLIGAAVDAIIPTLPHLMVQALSSRRARIQEAFARYFALAPSASPLLFEQEPESPSPSSSSPPPLPQLPESNGNNGDSIQ